MKNEPSSYKQLNKRQRAFVENWVALGGAFGTQKKAAILAGYPENSAKQTGYKMLRQPKILRAIREIVDRNIQGHLTLGWDTLRQLCEGDGTPAGVRLKAATEILNRGGLVVAQVHEHQHQVTLSEAQIKKEMAQLFKDDPGLKEAFFGDIIDITPKDVEKTREAVPKLAKPRPKPARWKNKVKLTPGVNKVRSMGVNTPHKVLDDVLNEPVKEPDVELEALKDPAYLANGNYTVYKGKDDSQETGDEDVDIDWMELEV